MADNVADETPAHLCGRLVALIPSLLRPPRHLYDPVLPLQENTTREVECEAQGAMGAKGSSLHSGSVLWVTMLSLWWEEASGLSISHLCVPTVCVCGGAGWKMPLLTPGECNLRGPGSLLIIPFLPEWLGRGQAERK